MSQGITESVDRRRRLQEELATATDGETITNTEMMNLWGVTKGRWSDLRNRMPDFPMPIVSGGVQLYPRQTALERMWAWETRNDKTDKEKARRMAALLGVDDFSGVLPSMSEMQKASQLRAEIEARMIAQGQLVRRGDVASLLARVFELQSKRLSSLGTLIDPNGAYPQELRDAADAAGNSLLMAMHGELKHMLGGDAAAGPGQHRSDRGGSAQSNQTGASRPTRGRRSKSSGHAAAAAGG